jgi:hypothetical protein
MNKGSAGVFVCFTEMSPEEQKFMFSGFYWHQLALKMCD